MIVEMLGAGKKLMAISKGVAPPAMPLLHKVNPLIASLPAGFTNAEVNHEELLSTDRDIVFVSKNSPTADAVEEQDELPVFRLGFTTFPEMKTAIELTGQVLGGDDPAPWDRYGPEAALQVQWAARQLHPALFGELDVHRDDLVQAAFHSRCTTDAPSAAPARRSLDRATDLVWRCLPLTRTRRKLLTCGFATPWLSPARCAPRPNAKRLWSLCDRLDERDIADLITAYREGTTAASLTAARGLSLKSVKRILNIAGVRRTPPTQRAMKATPTATHL